MNVAIVSFVKQCKCQVSTNFVLNDFYYNIYDLYSAIYLLHLLFSTTIDNE